MYLQGNYSMILYFSKRLLITSKTAMIGRTVVNEYLDNSIACKFLYFSFKGLTPGLNW